MDLGVYGNTAIHTPHLDRLAAAGTVFTSAYTHVSSCSPSRAALLSGLPSHQNGMYGLQHGVEHFASFDHVVSVANALNNAGYVTGIIGKYHIWPATDFNFTWGNNPTGPGGCQTALSLTCPGTDYNYITRNITHMHQAARQFITFAEAQGKPWFLYVGFGDSHRCGGPVGEFCQYYGFDNATQTSTIPDWQPVFYQPQQVVVPHWIQDTPAARQDLAGMYTAKNRMDQGVGLLLDLVWDGGARQDSTLVAYLADNGAPFAAGKTNFYEPGSVEPCIISAPGAPQGGRSDALVSSLDMFPTILDWARVPLPAYSLNGVRVQYTGRSLLPLLQSPQESGPEGGALGSQHAAAAAAFTAEAQGLPHPQVCTTAQLQLLQAQRRARRGVPTSQQQQQQQQLLQHASQGSLFGREELQVLERPLTAASPPPLPANYTRIFHSFQLHEIQEYYPMRAVHAQATPHTRYHLIYNIAHFLPYPIASDLWAAPAFQDLVARAAAGLPNLWYRNITEYLRTPRAPYELYDLELDPAELNNVAGDTAYGEILSQLQADIKAYQYATNDDWTIKYEHE